MAASSSSVINIKPFDGNGYSNWEYRVKLMLEQKEVIDVVTMEPPEDAVKLAEFRKNDVRARNIIVQCLADNMLETIKDKKTAKEIMDALRGTYLKRGISNQVQLQQKLRNLRYTDKDSLNTFLTEFEQTVSELRNSGGTIQNCEIVTQLLSAMPESYQTVTTAIDVLFCQNEEKISLDFVKNKLLMEEARQKKNRTENETSDQQAFAGYRKQKFRNNTKSGATTKEGRNTEFKFRCYGCGEKGHKKSECTKIKTYGKCNVSKKEEEEEEISFLTSVCQENQENFSLNCEANKMSINFVVDSGATNHLVKQSYGKYMINTREVYHKINVAKLGESIIAKRQGDLQLETEEGKQITMHNVLECEGLSHNLISVRNLEDKGLQIMFENSKVVVKQKSKVVMEGKLRKTLYELNFKIRSVPYEINLTNDDKNLWHKRMGHSSKYPSTDLCTTCLKGKQTRIPFKPLTEERKPKRILEVISSDVCGPITPATFDGKKYFLTFIDHYSHFAVCYLLTCKSEVLENFKHYIAMVEAKFNKKVEKLRCDNGGEYGTKNLQNFCKEKGITIQYTVPRNPEQNGVAERYNRTLMEKARCIIIDANIDKKFWGEAVRTSVYLTNRTETSTLRNNETPAEVWNGEKPNLNKIKVFGCTAHAHVPKENRSSKLDERSKQMFMIGYTNNGYRLWDSDEGKVVIARSVVFDETKTDNTNKNSVKSQIYIKENDSKENFQSSDRSSDVNSKSNENKLEEVRSNDENHRNTRRRQLPSHFNDFEMSFMNALIVNDFGVPNSYKEAVQVGNGWPEAVKEELAAHEKNETWDIVKVPQNAELIDSRWIFRIKESNGETIKKARLVARGFLQSNVDEEVYAPVARMVTIFCCH